MVEEEKEKEEEKDAYRLEATLKEVGVLYPILVDASGKHVIDGYHRLKVDPQWPAFKLEHIQTPVQIAMARLLANIHSKSEKADRDERGRLLGELVKAGLTPKEIAGKLGMSYTWVVKYLPSKFKVEEKAEAGKLGGETKAEIYRESQDSATRRVAEIEATAAPSPPGEPKVKTKSAKPAEHEEPELEIVYNPTVDEREKYIEELNLWFLEEGHRLLTILTKYCYDKEIYWTSVVEQALTEFFKKEGYL